MADVLVMGMACDGLRGIGVAAYPPTRCPLSKQALPLQLRPSPHRRPKRASASLERVVTPNASLLGEQWQRPDAADDTAATFPEEILLSTTRARRHASGYIEAAQERSPRTRLPTPTRSASRLAADCMSTLCRRPPLAPYAGTASSAPTRQRMRATAGSADVDRSPVVAHSGDQQEAASSSSSVSRRLHRAATAEPVKAAHDRRSSVCGTSGSGVVGASIVGAPIGITASSGALHCGWSPQLACSEATRKKPPKLPISLLRPCTLGRPPMLLFRGETGSPMADRAIDAEDLAAIGLEQESLPKMYFCIVESKDCHEYKAVVETFQAGGLYRVAAGSPKFSLYWGPNPTPDMLRTMHPFQKANHFPASWNLGRKDLLWKNVNGFKRNSPQHFNLMPITFVMPEEFQAWVAAREKQPDVLWIWKPVALSCGKGIRVVTSKADAEFDEKIASKPGVISRYVDNPLLINGYKFDLRLYVVVTSFDPLKVYLNAQGLVRLATEQYSSSPDSLSHRTMHLTNYSVNKHSETYVQNNDAAKDDGSGGSQNDKGSDAPHASKWSLGQLRTYLATLGHDYDAMMAPIKDLIVKTLIAVEPPIVSMWLQGASFGAPGSGVVPQVGPNQNCFEIYGFDVMIDEKLKPWLLEVNIFPSFASSSVFDKRVKSDLIADTLTMVGLLPYDHDALMKSLKEDATRRLQGLAPKQMHHVSRSHDSKTVLSASVEDFGEGEWRLILDAFEENARRGNLERLYPTMAACKKFSQLFSLQRYSNQVLARWLACGGERCLSPLLQRQCCSAVFEP